MKYLGGKPLDRDTRYCMHLSQADTPIIYFAMGGSEMHCGVVSDHHEKTKKFNGRRKKVNVA
jgi:hypothetical protein